MKLLILVYFWIYDEYYWGFSVNVSCYKLVCYWVLVIEMNFNKLFVVVCFIYDVLVNVLKKNKLIN